MKHAILILAHKNIGQLCRLVEYFKHDCDVFIHIDKKQTIKPADKEKILGFEQVKFISQDINNWVIHPLTALLLNSAQVMAVATATFSDSVVGRSEG